MDSDTSPFVEKSVFERITNYFVQNELNTKEEAYMCFIPSLTEENKLPNLLSTSRERLDEPACGLKTLLERYPDNKDILYGLLHLPSWKNDQKVVNEILTFESENKKRPSVL